MFGINIRRLLFICEKIPVRHLRNQSRRPIVLGSNPGLDNRLNAFREDGVKIQDDDAEEFIEQSESSFYDVEETYNSHLKESLVGKHQLRHHIVKEKYFKENMPNLLTWSEKEQIRHLASTQPEEWTPQRIAESFPVTEQVVKKLLKYPWKPANEDRIARHDASAMRNWTELKEGTLDIPEELRTHFLRFSKRTIPPPLSKKSIKLDISQEKIGEFEQIVRRCASVEEDNYTVEVENNECESKKSPTTKKDFKRITLDELANKIKSRLDEGKTVEVPDKMIMDSVTSVPSKTDNPERNIERELHDKRRNETHLSHFKEKDDKIDASTQYPERIRIPKKAYQKGATYKINDCFYDHDGRFLYRVVGLTASH